MPPEAPAAAPLLLGTYGQDGTSWGVGTGLLTRTTSCCSEAPSEVSSGWESRGSGSPWTSPGSWTGKADPAEEGTRPRTVQSAFSPTCVSAVVFAVLP